MFIDHASLFDSSLRQERHIIRNSHGAPAGAQSDDQRHGYKHLAPPEQRWSVKYIIAQIRVF